MKKKRVWISRDKGIYDGMWLWTSKPVWAKDGDNICMGDGMLVSVLPKLGLKRGQCKEFEIRAMKADRGTR